MSTQPRTYHAHEHTQGPTLFWNDSMATKNSTSHAAALADLQTLNDRLEQILPQLPVSS